MGCRRFFFSYLKPTLDRHLDISEFMFSFHVQGGILKDENPWGKCR